MKSGTKSYTWLCGFSVLNQFLAFLAAGWTCHVLQGDGPLLPISKKVLCCFHIKPPAAVHALTACQALTFSGINTMCTNIFAITARQEGIK